MNWTFICCKEYCSKLNTLCTETECCIKSSAVSNTTRCNYRNLNCIHNLWNKCHSCLLTYMSASFTASSEL